MLGFRKYFKCVAMCATSALRMTVTCFRTVCAHVCACMCVCVHVHVRTCMLRGNVERAVDPPASDSPGPGLGAGHSHVQVRRSFLDRTALWMASGQQAHRTWPECGPDT